MGLSHSDLRDRVHGLRQAWRCMLGLLGKRKTPAPEGTDA